MTSRSLSSGDCRRNRTLAALSLAALLVAPHDARAQLSFESAGVPATDASTAPPTPPRVVTVANWEDSDPVPVGYHVVSWRPRAPIVGGAAVFVLSYSLSALVAAEGQAPALWVPVLGPAVEIGLLRAPRGTLDGAFVPAGVMVLGLDLILQAVGAGALAYGLAVPRRSLVRNEAGLRVTPAPMGFGRGGAGVGLIGTF